MKKLVCFLFALSLFFSCNNEIEVIKEPVVYSIYEKMDEEELRVETEKLEAVTLQQLLQELTSQPLNQKTMFLKEPINKNNNEGVVVVKGYRDKMRITKDRKVLLNK